VLHVLYSVIHREPDAATASISALTAAVNSELAGRGESSVNERKIGNILTSLSLTNRTRRKTGFVLWLDRSTRERIHAAAREHSMEDPVETCGICNPTSVPPVKSAAEAPKREEIPSQELPSERGERGECGERRKRQSGTGKTRLRTAASSRRRSPRS